jgi:hypothetical protein
VALNPPAIAISEPIKCSIFFGAGLPGFCWGFWQKRGAERGFLMVNLWWIAGESWYVDDHFSDSKNMPLFQDLFLRGFPFWE